MVKVSYEQKYRKAMMEAKCIASPSNQTLVSTGSLGIAISEAVEKCVMSNDVKYALGSVLNHVLMHQTIIGLEAKKQLEDSWFKYFSGTPNSIYDSIEDNDELQLRLNLLSFFD